MGRETERKFLIRNDSWRPEVRRSERLRQGYLVVERDPNGGDGGCRVDVCARIR